MNEKSLRNGTSYILLLEKGEMNLKKTEDNFYHLFFAEKAAFCKSKHRKPSFLFD